MSKSATHQRSGGRHDQHSAAGRDLYNPNPAQALYDREFNDIHSRTTDAERMGAKIINDNADAVRSKEATPTLRRPSNPVSHSGRTVRRRALFTSKKLRGKTSLITVALVLFGGGGAVSLFASPSLAIVQLRQVLTQDLNDQLKAFDTRHAFMTRAKLKTTISGSCGVVKIACRFSTMSDKQAERYKSRGITIERDMKGSILPGRGKVTSMTIQNADGGNPIKITSASELTDKTLNDPVVRAAMQKAENPWFASMTDKTFKTTLKLLGASKSSRIKGDTNEEREKSVNNVIGETKELDTTNLTPEKNDKGEDTGRYIGPDGQVMSQAQIDEINSSAKVADGAMKIKPSSIAGAVGKTVLATGALDVACTAFNANRMVAALAKSDKAKQAAQMATATLLTPADKIMAGVATDGETEFVGNKINNIGGQAQPDQVVDESKLYDAGSQTNTPMKDNPNRYATAFDSPGVKAALHGDVTQLDSSQARFSLASGFIGTLANINEYIARVVNFGDSDPKKVSEKCRFIQNPYVRGASLIAGIFIGIGSFGTWQAAGIAASLGVSMALPYALSVAADIASGDMFKNLYGMDFGSGAFVGTAAIMSSAAQHRGMKPLSDKEAVAYTESNKQTLAQYADTQRYLARSEPLNIYNQYSFVGSLASALTPALSQSRSSAGMFAMGLSSIIPTTLATLTGTAKADNTIERFQQCDDPGYASLGIGADLYCNVRYGLSDEELAMDPVENAKWMVATGNVGADDDSGEALDNGQSWNYKKFMDECANRTVGYGEDQEENQGDGSNCLSTANESLNKHFRVFTMDLSVADYMDGIDDVSNTTKTSSGTDLSKVYVVGDSITVGARDGYQYEQKLKSAGAGDVKISGSSSSNITSANGGTASGLAMVDQDQDYVKSATTIIVAMGTNGMTNAAITPEAQRPAMQEMIDKIKSLNKNATIYWVDTAMTNAVNSGAQPTAANMNKIIYDNQSMGYKVISWAKAVDPAVDPATQTKPVNDPNGYIESSGVHPSAPKGYEKYVDTIIGALKSDANDGATASSDGWVFPTTTDAEITSGYKPADRPDHLGIDLAQRGGALGKPIYAARGGTVVASGPATGFGNWIVIEHDVDGKKMSTVYGHMRANDLLVKVGDTVKAGQLIARIGSEGNSTGPHLHFEIWNGNRLQEGGDNSIDPTPIVTKAKQTATGVNG